MATLMQASRQWATRPDDERFTSLLDMSAHFDGVRSRSKETIVSSRKIDARPTDDNMGLEIYGPNGIGYAPTNWAFGQLAQLAEAPGGYLRSLPSPIAADCINYGLQFKRNIEDVGILLHRTSDKTGELRAATGPRYGRIWNADVTRALVDRFGDGISGEWKVPGEFSKDVIVTKANTTLYAGDRDMFVFLADEKNRIEMPNRRAGLPGSLARGFFMWNSEVGSQTFGIATFLFDYACSNRMVWGAAEFREIRIRHTASAPDKWLDEAAPALVAYSNSSAMSIVDGIKKAQLARIDNVDEFLAKRFSKRLVGPLKMTHTVEEARPIETLWDAATAVTAYAKTIGQQDERVKLERAAGDIMDLAA